jgi:hypothetical protein
MSAIEYNMAGRWFINNHTMPYCEKVSFIPTVKEVVAAINSVRSRKILNLEGREFYLSLHSKDKFLRDIKDLFKR